MPTIYERPVTRKFNVALANESESISYFVTGTSNEQEVYELLLNESPVALGPYLIRKTIQAEPLPGGHWFGEVEYATPSGPGGSGDTPLGVEPAEPAAPSPDTPLGPSFSIDTTGATVHITQSLETVYKTTPTGPNNGPDNKRAIGLTKDRVEGTDVYAPAFTFTKTVARANVTMAYINAALYGLVGRTNDAPFYGFARGEVLYLGCTGNFTQRERWTLTHKFACQPNEADVDVGGNITVPKKKGWEYLWVAYAPAKVGNQVLQEPTCAYVERVYKEGDFSKLQIGAAA